ncbi:acyl-CoA N-acyltransferase, partial [Catenaria anguillulae PL171]
SHDQSIHLGTLRAPWPYTEQDAKETLDSYASRPPAEQDMRLAIRLGAPDAPVVGTICWDRPEELPRDRTTPLNECPHVVWEVGYWLATPYRGQGILPHVLQHVVKKVAWDQRDVVARVEVAGYVDNIASRRVAEKAGFVFEGIKRGAVVKGGEVRDLAVYSWIP